MMRKCEDEKMRDRPPLLEEPCAQTLPGKIPKTVTIIPKTNFDLFEHVMPHALRPESNTTVRFETGDSHC